jgi:hypothetical protein
MVVHPPQQALALLALLAVVEQRTIRLQMLVLRAAQEIPHPHPQCKVMLVVKV